MFEVSPQTSQSIYWTGEAFLEHGMNEAKNHVISQT